MRKLIIIGSGPAGYTAGIYAARAKLEPLILAGEIHGGQLMNTTVVENWPGSKTGIMGPELMREMREQAQKFGAEIIDKNVVKVDFSKRSFTIDDYQAEAVIITTGASSLMLGVPGEKELLGRGVATCAVCDAPFYKEKIAVVAGGGDAACEDSLALTKFAKQVYLVVRRDSLRASKIMAERVMKHPRIKIFWNTQVKQILGGQKVEAVEFTNGEKLTTDGVFLAIGHQPATGIFKSQIDLDFKGYIITGLNKDYPTMTGVAGVFAAGDVVDHRYKQAITAAGMGCMAALDAEKWLENIK
ncbi:thioredoxin-disulfide reductase [Candidatus Beckwithbacteria bacterium CG22_combo_CG10-13_8_21_14_all_01_47_9]|uniref:Thioredoxin reductase n=2 Tax=Candidatus Beckwithiibacteriota TaxID=1752726 RepID=A0A2H0DZW0_9BACT|nr:MAG: thioredoxin-disulfide reductase [Candidatus Beckwithbacteria bacterium CG22_combo_CG10-13_8_21_14_all_01_47_9]PJC66383.1 MAG: thioredoxin-disulfide reductase [Candidatus Beckwithbacteria bacterium CG_4_9_14_0_2_um_filter_47_11]